MATAKGTINIQKLAVTSAGNDDMQVFTSDWQQSAFGT